MRCQEAPIRGRSVRSPKCRGCLHSPPNHLTQATSYRNEERQVSHRVIHPNIGDLGTDSSIRVSYHTNFACSER